MDNLASPWAAPSIVHQNTLAYPLPEAQKISWISWDDMAACVVAALKHPEYAGQSFRVGGSQTLTGRQLAEIFSIHLGNPISYYPVPLDDFAAGLLIQPLGNPWEPRLHVCMAGFPEKALHIFRSTITHAMK